jgi:Asp-tRNA(Asn)/Glu-tRNA(Gln) amidotransferase C subunit
MDFKTTQVQLEEALNNKFKEIAEELGDIINFVEQASINKTSDLPSVHQIKNRSDRLAAKGDLIINRARLYVLDEILNLTHSIFHDE